MKIAVAGIGYVGLANAVLLAQNNEVVAFDVNEKKVEMLAHHKAPFADEKIQEYLTCKQLNLKATSNNVEAFGGADYVIVATPTNYDPDKEYFDTESVETVISMVREIEPNAAIVIKSTIPVGFTKKMRDQHKCDNIYFSPEFLREGRALYDNLHPSRIVVGGKDNIATQFSQLLVEGAEETDIPVLLMDSTEAEAIKLFANTFLALRVAYFNELDTYAEMKGLNVGDIIKGICYDPRIGDYYNNPSFGYGGYCLPKDSKQLLANFRDVPNDLIKAIVQSNETRKDFVAEQILKAKPDSVGIYRLTMKTDSDNFRESSIQGVISRLRDAQCKIVVYEPTLNAQTWNGCEVCDDLKQFKDKSSIIIANRWADDLKDVEEKVYTRDLYRRD